MAALVALVASGGALVAGPQPKQRFAVVVHKANPIAGISRAEVHDIFLKRRATWSTGATIIPINAALGTPLRRAFDQQMLGMTPKQVGEHWVKAAITGQGAPPRQVGSSSVARRMVAALRGAIAYIDVSAVDGSVKVLRVDGRLPTDAQYPFAY